MSTNKNWSNRVLTDEEMEQLHKIIANPNNEQEKILKSSSYEDRQDVGNVFSGKKPERNFIQRLFSSSDNDYETTSTKPSKFPQVDWNEPDPEHEV